MMNSKMEKSNQKTMESEEVIKSRQDTPKLLLTVVQVKRMNSRHKMYSRHSCREALELLGEATVNLCRSSAIHMFTRL